MSDDATNKLDENNDAWERASYDSEGNKLPDWEMAWRKQYVASLTPEDLEEMSKTTDVDVRAKLRAHIARLKTEEAKDGHSKAS